MIAVERDPHLRIPEDFGLDMLRVELMIAFYGGALQLRLRSEWAGVAISTETEPPRTGMKNEKQKTNRRVRSRNHRVRP
jgi:hypothetical protein